VRHRPGSRFGIQFTPQPIALRDASLVAPQRWREAVLLRPYVAIPRQCGDKIPLAGNMALTEGDVRLSLCQMLLVCRSL
jgi:hypothetical protein